MTPGDFLRAVWPTEGYYCIAHPFKIPETGRHTFSHKVFDDISAAVSYVLQTRGSKDIFYAVLSLKAREIFDSEKWNYKTGTKGAPAVRTHQNMAASRAFFFDIDVKQEDGHYHTREAAIAALTQFIGNTQLPWPMVVSSGNGFHVYWTIDRALPVDEWLRPATELKGLAKAHNLLVDHSRTTDVSSVLRVAGTSNWKDPHNPTAVDVLRPAPANPTDTFLQLVADAAVRAGLDPIAPTKTRATTSGLGSNMEREYDGPPTDLKDVGDACAQVRELLKTRGNVSQSAWYHGILNVVKYTTSGDKDGRQLAHMFSQGHPQYDASETDAKLDQLEQNVNAPAKCATIREHSPWGDSLCANCIFRNDPAVPNPLVAARRSAQAPAPQIPIQLAIGAPVQQITIPDPPAPFKRLKGGGIAAIVPVGDDEEKVEVIYPYDLYPLRRLINPVTGTEQHVWVVDLPRQGKREFVLDADALYDQRKFVTAIANQGIFPHRSYLQRMQEYMTAYISELQRLVDADIQSGHLGWSEDHTQFVLPDRVLYRDGSQKPASLSLGAQRASEQIYSKGSLQRQVELLRFYNAPQYVANQFVILCSLGSILMHMTGYHGVIVNASGDAGASKSTTLYTGASMWGVPDLYPINGTNSGATVRARNERVTTLANLPICVDEITHLPVKEAQDLAMGITQPGHRLRLETNGVERRATGGSKSTILVSTANNSLHNLLSLDNAAGTAGSMRVFEIIFKATNVHKKYEADDYMRELRENFGHIGPAFLSYVIQNYDLVRAMVQAQQRKLDQLAEIQSGERFWSAPAACALAAGIIARNLGLLSFGVENIERWVVSDQIPRMRGVVNTEYSTPLAVLTDYIEQINANMVVVSKPEVTSFGSGAVAIMHHEPRGALMAHYDTDIGTMAILKTGFKHYCQRVGANYLRVMDELNTPTPTLGLTGDESRIILNKDARRTLGAGTKYAKGQSWCFVVNMRHPDICEHPKIRVVSNMAAAANDTAAQA